MPGAAAAKKKKKRGAPPPPNRRSCPPELTLLRCSVAGGQPLETRDVRPWRFVGIPVKGGAAAQGERLLDSHIAPSTYRGRGTNWPALDHSRTKLEKLVLAEPPEHGQRARAWGGLHKHYQKAWLDKDGDRVPTVAALWFCAEVTRKKEHDESWVCVVAVALLAAARTKGPVVPNLNTAFTFSFVESFDLTVPGGLLTTIRVSCALLPPAAVPRRCG